ncbi:MAG: lipid-binding SYLF domain-containing protein [Desulfarculus sp.]|nr:lipid-binding SYLF domain-containing protein [Desulfarculus sp.]
MTRRWGLVAGMAWLLVAAAFGPALAGSKSEANLKVTEAQVVMEQVMSSGDASIPQDLLQKAKAVAIFPDMVKAGFLVGGQYGTGVVMTRRDDGSWGPPAFFTMGGVSFGLQLGAQAADVVLVIMKQRGLDGLLTNKIRFGADLGVAVGPVGRRGEASISAASGYADAYSYSRTKGLFAGLSLEGGGIEYDAQTTSAFYGKSLKVRDVLKGGKVSPPEPAKTLMKTMDRFAR